MQKTLYTHILHV